MNSWKGGLCGLIRVHRTLNGRKILEEQRRTSLKKCSRDLRECNIPLTALLDDDETAPLEMEVVMERFYSNLFRSSTPVSRPNIPTDEAPPRILP
ncbi:hypothetical protein RB195_001341 [Necator americanus]|uniref:Uncharacterized protein n=1 Tax=Necator americanus TaxID=51031 RepID=A0ABR1DDV6_NECAM